MSNWFLIFLHLSLRELLIILAGISLNLWVTTNSKPYTIVDNCAGTEAIKIYNC